jgi:hypothetical protein
LVVGLLSQACAACASPISGLCVRNDESVVTAKPQGRTGN